MCTVTLVPLGCVPGSAWSPPRWRLMVNRDEQRTRPPAEAPRVVRCGPRQAVAPVDPDSGGTWVGMNDAGLAAVLLNATPPPDAKVDPSPAAGGFLSRGIIIPQLLAASSLDAALVLALDLQASRWPRFRLLLVQDHHHAIVTSDGTELHSAGPVRADGPIMLASSGLGDHLVERPRRIEFERAVLSIAATHTRLESDGDQALALYNAQSAFHHTHLAAAGATSVLMARADAQTVSITTIECESPRLRMLYRPVEAGQLTLGAETATTLTLRPTENGDDSQSAAHPIVTASPGHDRTRASA